MRTLTQHQEQVMRRVVEEEGGLREHLVVYLSGAHAYGFPSPDSDLDLKCIHVAPTASLVGLEPPQLTFDRAEIIDGVEIDYTSNELSHALAGILQGNGNFIERVLGRTAIFSSSLLDELQPLVRRSLSRRVLRHYRGFARNQAELLEKEPTVKKLLYVLRTALTGIHLLATSELETDLTRLMKEHDLEGAHALVAAKRAGERTAAEPSLLLAWRPRLAMVLAQLESTWSTSVLPPEPEADAVRALEAWLVSVRRARFA